MTFNEAQMEIESGAMITRLNVASGLKMFLRGIQGEAAVQDLRSMLAARDIQEQVLSRLIQLSRQRIDKRYENPWDTTLTVYLWAISSVNQALCFGRRNRCSSSSVLVGTEALEPTIE